MLHLRAHQHLMATLLWLVMALGALAPGVSSALSLARGDGAPWSAVCSAEADRASGARVPGLPDEAVGQLLSHCPFCHLQADTLSLPPVATWVLPLLRLQMAVPRLFLQSPQPLVAWAPAQARAPPQAS